MTVAVPHAVPLIMEYVEEQHRKLEADLLAFIDDAGERPFVAVAPLQVVDSSWLAGRRIYRSPFVPPGTAYTWPPHDVVLPPA